MLTSLFSKMADEVLTGSLSRSLACGYDLSMRLFTLSSRVAMFVNRLVRIKLDDRLLEIRKCKRLF
jgi:hypothetical protein